MEKAVGIAKICGKSVVLSEVFIFFSFKVHVVDV